MKRFCYVLFTFAFLCVSFVWAQTPPEFKGHDELILAVAFSNDGSMLATASGDATVRIWTYASGKESQVLKGPTKVAATSVAFNKDGSLIATAWADGSIRVWNPKDGKLVKDLAKAHAGGANAVAFSPDGSVLASGGTDKAVKLWNAKDLKELKTLGSHQKTVYGVAFSADGGQIASCGYDGVIKVWDVKAQKEIKSMMVERPKSKDEPKKDAPKDKDVKDKKGKKDMGKGPPTLDPDGILAVAFSPDGKFVLSGGVDRYLHYWNIADGKASKKLGPTTDDIHGLAISRDGKYVATAGYGGSLHVYEIATGNEVYDNVKAKLNRKAQITYGVAFAPDNRSVVTAQHDLKSGKGVAKVTAVLK